MVANVNKLKRLYRNTDSTWIPSLVLIFKKSISEHKLKDFLMI